MAEETLSDRIAAVEAWVKKRDTVSAQTVTSLATQFKLTAKEVRVIIDRARYKLASHAEAYVEAHMESVARGLEIGKSGGKDATAGLRVAQEGAAWALERIGQGHSRVLDAPKAQGATGPQIVIGIQVGGVTTANTAREEVIEGDVEAKEAVIVTPNPRVQVTPTVTITQKAQEEVAPSAKSVPKVPAKRGMSQKARATEAKVQKILAAVTPANAQVMMRSIMDLGYEAAFSWELVKATLDIEEKLG